MNLLDLERRLTAAEGAQHPQQPAPITDTHKRRIAVSRFEQEKARALADPTCSELRRRRYEANYSVAALAIMAGCSADTVRRAEAGDPRTSPASLRRLARALGLSVASIMPPS